MAKTSKKIIEGIEDVMVLSTDVLAHRLSIFYESAEEIQNILRKAHENLLANETIKREEL